MKKNWVKGIALALAFTIAAAGASPAQAQAASAKKLIVNTNAKAGSGVRLHKKDLHVHAKTAQLKVRYGRQDVTKKASYKPSSKKVLSVNKDGRITVRKKGTAGLVVKYKGKSVKLTVTAAKHQWKTYYGQKGVWAAGRHCNCGDLLPAEEHKYCAKCRSYRTNPKSYDGWCHCKADAHLKKHKDAGEDAGTYDAYYPLKVKYPKYKSCSCGAVKRYSYVPKDYDAREKYEDKGCITELYEEPDDTDYEHDVVSD